MGEKSALQRNFEKETKESKKCGTRKVAGQRNKSRSLYLFVMQTNVLMSEAVPEGTLLHLLEDQNE